MVIDVNGVQLFYEKTGQGPPMVLLHGNSEDHTIFANLVQALKEQYTLYAVDSRGHGQSSKVPHIGYHDMAEDIAALVTQLYLKRPVLVGFSDGAIVGLLLAGSHPALLGGLVSCGANINPGQLKKWFRLVAWLGWRFTKDDKLRMMLEEPQITPEDLGRIAVPTLVLAGSRDILPTAQTREIAAAIPNATLQILQGQTHSSYIGNCNVLVQAMRPFLQTL